MTTYLIEVDGVTPVTNPDGSITLPITPKVPASSIQVIGLVPLNSAGSKPLPGALVGDTVSSIVIISGVTGNGGAGTDLSPFFESTISMAGHIVQIDALSTISGDPWGLVVLARPN